MRTAAWALSAAVPWAYLLLVRPWHLHWGATSEEATRDLPGDGLVRHPTFESTRAVTIAAPPERVWPWIAQMGTGRAGYYSIDLLDNNGRRSASRIHPEWQELNAGDVMPTGRNGSGFTVAQLDKGRLLVLHDPAPKTPRGVHGAAMVWIIALEPCPAGTRLLSRIRARTGLTAGSQLYAMLIEAIDFVMMRAMLANIRSRAESAAAERAPVPAGLAR